MDDKTKDRILKSALIKMGYDTHKKNIDYLHIRILFVKSVAACLLVAIMILNSVGFAIRIKTGLSLDEYRVIVNDVNNFNKSVKQYKRINNDDKDDAFSGLMLFLYENKKDKYYKPILSYKTIKELRIFVDLANPDREIFSLFYDKGIPVPKVPSSWGELVRVTLTNSGSLLYTYASGKCLYFETKEKSDKYLSEYALKKEKIVLSDGSKVYIEGKELRVISGRYSISTYFDDRIISDVQEIVFKYQS